jgi:hypothetical protein
LLAGANINSTNNNDDISPLVWAIDQLNMAYEMEAMDRRRWRVKHALCCLIPTPERRIPNRLTLHRRRTIASIPYAMLSWSIDQTRGLISSLSVELILASASNNWPMIES